MIYSANMEKGGCFEASTVDALIQEMAEHYLERHNTGAAMPDIKSIAQWDNDGNEEMLPVMIVGMVQGKIESLMDEMLQGQMDWSSHVGSESLASIYL